MSVLWDARNTAEPQITSQQVQALLGSDVALTTVLTVLSRLCQKKLAIKTQGSGRSLLFASATTREEHSAQAMLELVANSQNPALAFAHFAKKLGPEDLVALRDLLAQEAQ